MTWTEFYLLRIETGLQDVVDILLNLWVPHKALNILTTRVAAGCLRPLFHETVASGFQEDVYENGVWNGVHSAS
jgi:hypothetical protein